LSLAKTPLTSRSAPCVVLVVATVTPRLAVERGEARHLLKPRVRVDDFADIGEHPDLGLPRLALDHRLELAVDGELNVAL
jgi:hypothetical protein